MTDIEETKKNTSEEEKNELKKEKYNEQQEEKNEKENNNYDIEDTQYGEGEHKMDMWGGLLFIHNIIRF